MSVNKPCYIPHPLCQHDTKIPRDDLENIDVYVRDASDPRWAASHLVRAIARGLLSADPIQSRALNEVADNLSSRKQ